MVIGYLGVMGIFAVPAETESKLRIDPDCMLPCAIFGQPVKFVSGRDFQEVEFNGGIQLAELAQSDGVNVGGKFWSSVTAPNGLSRPVGEALDHGNTMAGFLLASSASIPADGRPFPRVGRDGQLGYIPYHVLQEI